MASQATKMLNLICKFYPIEKGFSHLKNFLFLKYELSLSCYENVLLLCIANYSKKNFPSCTSFSTAQNAEKSFECIKIEVEKAITFDKTVPFTVEGEEPQIILYFSTLNQSCRPASFIFKVANKQRTKTLCDRK